MCVEAQGGSQEVCTLALAPQAEVEKGMVHPGIIPSSCPPKVQTLFGSMPLAQVLYPFT